MFADDSEVTISELIVTKPLLWSERTTKKTSDPGQLDPRIITGELDQ